MNEPSPPESTNVIEMSTPERAPDSGSVTQAPSAYAAMNADTENAVQPARKQRGGRSVILGGIVLALLWVSGAIAYLVGMLGLKGLAGLPPAQWTGLAFGIAGPALFILALGWAVREMVLFGQFAGQVRKMADRFADPARATREDASLLANTVQGQISRINQSVEGALARLGAMDEVLHHHAESFQNAETHARERTDALINDLRREREAVEELADQLDRKAAEIAQAISDQSKMVVSAADIANAQTSEGAKSISASVDLLNDASRRTETSSRSLQDHVQASAELLEQTVERLGQTRDELRANNAALRETQQDSLQGMDARKAEIENLAVLSTKSADELRQAASEGAMAMKQSLSEALDQARHYTSILREESRSMGDQHAARTKELKKAAEEAQSALEAYAESISRRLEHANEASFSAASWADKTFEKLQETTARLDERLAKLPEAADSSAREIEDKLRHGLSGLNEAAKQAAVEAQHIDASFQNRIRQNYELLSEMMLKMGATAAPMGSEVEVPNPLARRALPVEPKPEESAPKEATPPVAEPVKEEAPFVQTELRRAANPDDRDGGWRWRDVFSRIDKPEAGDQPETRTDPLPPDPASLDRLAGMFRNLDIEPDRVFEGQTYRAAALARLTDGRRAMAATAAAANRSAVNLLKDAFARQPELRLDAEMFTEELRHKVDDAARTGQQMHVETHLRTGDGPAFLLLEAALHTPG